MAKVSPGPRQSFLARYLAGDCRAVWKELVALREGVREPHLIKDATAVARETVRRARYNLELIYNRLLKLGYEFANPEAAFVLAKPDAKKQIAEIERRLGTLPILIRVWYETFSSVDFSQAEEQLEGPTGPDVNGLGSHPEMIMESLDRCWANYCKEVEEAGERAPADGDSEYFQIRTHPVEPFLPTGGVASNCDPKGLILPNLGIDGVLYNDGGGNMYFNKVLRRCFKWGGFPFCQYYLKGDTALPWEAQPNFEKIVPILKEGLFEI